LVLLVPTGSSLSSTEQLWQQARVRERLISPPLGDAMSNCFEMGLRRQAVEWEFRAEMTSIELVESYVAKGFGLGLTLLVPGCRYIPEVRVLPLPGFPCVPIGLIWRRNPDAVTAALMQAMEREAEFVRQEQLEHRSAA